MFSAPSLVAGDRRDGWFSFSDSSLAAPSQDTTALGHRVVSSMPASGMIAGALPAPPPPAQKAGPDPHAGNVLFLMKVWYENHTSPCSLHGRPPTVPPFLSPGTLWAGGQRACTSKPPSWRPRSALREPRAFPLREGSPPSWTLPHVPDRPNKQAWASRSSRGCARAATGRAGGASCSGPLRPISV